MQGIMEYRPGYWWVQVYFAGKKYIFYKDQFNKPLDSQRQAIQFRIYLESLKKKPGFDPSIFYKDKPFLFERALESWLLNSHVCLDQEKRKYYPQKFWMPRF